MAQTVRTSVPPVVRFRGSVPGATGTVGVTFSFYDSQTGLVPLWLETQNVTVDNGGNFNVLLGANHANGMPLNLFASGEARWLGVRPDGQPEQPRVMLVSVSYAMSAANADMLGGLPASAYLLTPNPDVTTGTSLAGQRIPSLHGSVSGTANQIAKFTDASTLGDSVVTETNGSVGIGTTTPQTALHVKAAAPALRLEDSALSSSAWDVVQSAYTADWFGILRQENNGSGWSPVATKSLLMSSDGLFGLGVANPATDLTDKLTVGAGNLKLTGTAGTNGVIFPDGTRQVTAYTGLPNTLMDIATDQTVTGVKTFSDGINGPIGKTTPDTATFTDVATGNLTATGAVVAGQGITTSTAVLTSANTHALKLNTDDGDAFKCSVQHYDTTDPVGVNQVARCGWNMTPFGSHFNGNHGVIGWEMERSWPNNFSWPNDTYSEMHLVFNPPQSVNGGLTTRVFSFYGDWRTGYVSGGFTMDHFGVLLRTDPTGQNTFQLNGANDFLRSNAFTFFATDFSPIVTFGKTGLNVFKDTILANRQAQFHTDGSANLSNGMVIIDNSGRFATYNGLDVVGRLWVNAGASGIQLLSNSFIQVGPFTADPAKVSSSVPFGFYNGSATDAVISRCGAGCVAVGDLDNPVSGTVKATSVTLASGATWTTGSDAPTGACANGSLYTRTDATGGLYLCVNTAWVAK